MIARLSITLCLLFSPLVVCFAVPPVAAQDFSDPDWMYNWESGPGANERAEQVLEGVLGRWDREQERANRRLQHEQMMQERSRQHGLSTCGTIYHNPALAAECRRSLGGW